jgi:hypothetical protein
MITTGDSAKTMPKSAAATMDCGIVQKPLIKSGLQTLAGSAGKKRSTKIGSEVQDLHLTSILDAKYSRGLAKRMRPAACEKHSLIG